MVLSAGSGCFRSLSRKILMDVEDVHGAFAAAVAAGGSEVHQPGPVPGVGYLAYVRDTEGNHLGLMQRDPDAKWPSMPV